MAGGFMAGFGTAFANSYNQASQTRANDESDMFKMQYQDYVSRRDQRDKMKLEDKKLINKAKALAEAYNQPPESWSKIYQMESSGVDTEKMLQNGGTFQIENNVTPSGTGTDSQPADPNTDLTHQASSAVGSQMAQSGMAAPPPGGGLFGDPVKAQDNNRFSTPSPVQPPVQQASNVAPPGVTDHAAQKNYSKIGQIAGGVSPEEVANTISKPYEPEALPGSSDRSITWKPARKDTDANSIEAAMTDVVNAEASGNVDKIAQAHKILDGQVAVVGIKATAQAKAEGKNYVAQSAVMRNPADGSYMGLARAGIGQDGQQIWIDPKTNQPVKGVNIEPFGEQTSKDVTVLADKVGKVADAQNKANENFLGAVRLNNEVGQLITANPAAAGRIGTAASVVDDYTRSIQQGIGLLTQSAQVDQKDPNSLTAVEKGLADVSALEDKLSEQVKAPMDEIHRTALMANLIDTKATRLAYMWAATQGQNGRSVSNEEFRNFKEAALGKGNPKGFEQGAGDFIMSEYKHLKDMAKSANQNNPDIKAFKVTHGFDSPIMPAQDIDELLAQDPETQAAFNHFKETNDQTLPSLSDSKQPAQDSQLSPADTKAKQNYLAAHGTEAGWQRLQSNPDGVAAWRD